MSQPTTTPAPDVSPVTIVEETGAEEVLSEETGTENTAAEETAAEETASTDAPATDSSVPAHRKIPKLMLFFGACAVVAILIYAVANNQNLSAVFTSIGDILAPVTIGGVIAYLCNPIMRFYEYIVFGKMKKGGLHHGLSLLMTVLTVFGLFAGLLALILPELINSIRHLIDNSGTYLESLLTYANSIIQTITAKLPIEIDISTPEKLVAELEKYIGSTSDILNKILGFVGDLNAVDGIWNFILTLFTAFKNLFLGLFIAFYILSSKEKRSAQVRKARAALLNEKQDKKLTEVVKLVDKTFGGFIKGLLLDAVAVGVITYIMLSIFEVSEYNLLIAAICAVTNIIPVFGPFIGAIPSALIVLITNPSKLLVFIILILVIQQIDGNILVPRIQGSNTGISSLAVLIAITVMGSLFGIMGMIIGVPLFAVIIELIKRALEERLRKRGLATDTVDYYPSDAVGNAEEEVYYEHSHLRYLYDHSKLKVYIDRIVARIERIKQKRAERRARRATPPSGRSNRNGGNRNGSNRNSGNRNQGRRNR